MSLPITKQSHQQEIGLLQDLINDAYYPPGEPGLKTDGIYGTGTAAAVRKWLLPYTGDSDKAVKAGTKVNFREWKMLWRDYIRDVVK